MRIDITDPEQPIEPLTVPCPMGDCKFVASAVLPAVTGNPLMTHAAHRFTADMVAKAQQVAEQLAADLDAHAARVHQVADWEAVCDAAAAAPSP
jgi:hypothetical protein